MENNSLKEYLIYCKEFRDYLNIVLSHCYKATDFAQLRGFKQETVDKCGIFYIDDGVKLVVPEYIDKIKDFGVISNTNKKPVFNDRTIIPIRDADGRILNLVGYKPNADERYVYGTARYYDRKNCMWGMENINLAYELGYAILTEGITDAIRLRDLGYANTFARCGTGSSEFICRQLNRCRYGVIHIGDRDTAGQEAIKRLHFYKRIILSISFKYKDVDEMCKYPENIDIVKANIDACIEEIKKSEATSDKNVDIKVTMMI